MKLLRALCECGFQSQKARVGYHFHQWWFPVLNTTTGKLSDISRRLPQDQIDQIQLGKVKALEFHDPFLEAVTRELFAELSGQPDSKLDPRLGSQFRCPKCRNTSLLVDRVPVTAFCKPDCGHTYELHDSEQRGCPICNYRPHHFRFDTESHFKSDTPTSSWCPCSSNMESKSYIDAYCPKSGELPDSYDVNGQSFCGMHHVLLGTVLVTRKLPIGRS